MPTDLQQIFAAVAFAEENEHESALNLMSRSTKKDSLWKTLGMKLGKFRRTVDDYQEKITFAEAGSFELVDEQPKEIREFKDLKLLVVGNNGKFSDEIIEYAIDMAKRLSYEIVALSAAPFSCSTMNLFSTQQKKLCEDFTTLAKENSLEFENLAKENEINFKHIIMFESPEEAQKSVFKNEKDIAFVISNKIEDRETNEQREGLRNRVFVYSMI
jgi:hypothetical protein